MADQLTTYYVSVPNEKWEQFAAGMQELGLEFRHVLPGEYFPSEEALERYTCIRKWQAESGEQKTEE